MGWTLHASSDPDVVRSMWTDPFTGAEHNYNIGFLTTGHVVLDVDTKDGKRGLDTFFDLGLDFDTLTMRTPSGGYHVVYAGVEHPVGSGHLVGPADGMDVKSLNAYVAAPGSTIDGLPYVVEIDAPVAAFPEHLRHLLKRPRERGTAPVTSIELDLPESVECAAHWLRREAPLAIAGANGDDTTFAVGCRIRDFGVSEETALELFLDEYNPRCEPPWSAGEARLKIENAYRYAKGAAGSASPAAIFESVVVVEHPGRVPPKVCPGFQAKRFEWKEPATFPRRRWIYGHHLIRKFFSCTFAPGGVGKTNLVLAEAISLAIGRSLLGGKLHEGPLRVWVLNLEDPLEELERRVITICLHYAVDPALACANLFLNSGRDTEVVIATTTREGTVIATPVVEALKATLKENKIDVVILDPFVSAHRVFENDNGAIDAVCKAIAGIADETDTAWDLVHHVRKGTGLETTVEDGRGAVSLLAASRSARVLNRMTKDEASRAGVGRPRDYFRVDNGKANLAPPPDRSDWYHLENVSLGNHGPNLFDEPSDQVGVVEEWQWPAAAAEMTDAHRLEIQKLVREGEWRENSQTKSKWVGNVVARVLSLDVTDAGHRGRLRGIIDICIKIDVLKLVHRQDGKREMKAFVEVGEWVPTQPAGPLGGTA